MLSLILSRLKTHQSHEDMNVYLGWKANGVLVQLHLFNVPQEPLALTDGLVSINRTLRENVTKLHKIIRIKLEYYWNKTRLTQTRDKIDKYKKKNSSQNMEAELNHEENNIKSISPNW